MDGEAVFQTHILVKYHRWKYNREGVKYFGYSVYDTDIPVKRMFKEYWKRFGIEYSYKLMNQTRVRTSTKKTVLRLLYVGLCFLLVNIWISFNRLASAYFEEGSPNHDFQNHVKTKYRKIEEKLGFQ